MARLGIPAEARDVLAPVYAWLPKGCAAPVLKEEKAPAARLVPWLRPLRCSIPAVRNTVGYRLSWGLRLSRYPRVRPPGCSRRRSNWDEPPLDWCSAQR